MHYINNPLSFSPFSRHPIVATRAMRQREKDTGKKYRGSKDKGKQLSRENIRI
jgi:hypothetical protein